MPHSSFLLPSLSLFFILSPSFSLFILILHSSFFLYSSFLYSSFLLPSSQLFELIDTGQNGDIACDELEDYVDASTYELHSTTLHYNTLQYATVNHGLFGRLGGRWGRWGFTTTSWTTSTTAYSNLSTDNQHMLYTAMIQPVSSLLSSSSLLLLPLPSSFRRRFGGVIGRSRVPLRKAGRRR